MYLGFSFTSELENSGAKAVSSIARYTNFLPNIESTRYHNSEKALVQNDSKETETLNGATKSYILNGSLGPKISNRSANLTGSLKQRYPECIIIGARKCGTRALGEFLNVHPDIEVSFEPHFFEVDSTYKKGLEYYRKQMPYTLPGQITIEKTPMYFISRMAAKRIHHFNENLKLIVTLRHPVKRLISDYGHVRREDIRKGRDHDYTIEELVLDNESGEVNAKYRAVNISKYVVHLKRWLGYFPRNQIHIVNGDNLIINPVEEIEKIETFLGLEHKVTKDKVYFDRDKGFFCYIVGDAPQCLSSSKGHKHPELDPGLYNKLMEYFKDYNERLFDLLGYRFNWD